MEWVVNHSNHWGHPGSKIFLISDPSHYIKFKKCCNNFDSSFAPGQGTKDI